MLNILGDYFSNRSSFVKGNVQSLTPSVFGVLQGSQLGPIMYNIFSSSLCSLELKSNSQLCRR